MVRAGRQVAGPPGDGGEGPGHLEGARERQVHLGKGCCDLASVWNEKEAGNLVEPEERKPEEEHLKVQFHILFNQIYMSLPINCPNKIF